MKKVFLFPVVAAIVLSACSSNDAVLATVGGRDITKSEFNAYLKFKRINPRDEEQRAKLVDQYVEREALAAAVEKKGTLDQAMIDAELREFRKEMLISRFFEAYLKDQVSDEAVRNYYVANEKAYQERKAHVAHILVRTNRNMGEAERKAKLTTAQAAHTQILSGKDFAEVAANYSEDSVSSKKGGDLGWLKEGAIDPRFSEKVFSMKPGDVSEPFETAFGYHIVKMLEGPTIVTQPLEAVKGNIRYALRNQAKEAELKRLRSSIKTKKTGS